jgi:hypothetical protein
MSSSIWSKPELRRGPEEPADPFALVPKRTFFSTLAFTGRFAIAGFIGWAAPGQTKRVDAGWEAAALDMRIADGGTGRCILTLGDPDDLRLESLAT